MADLSLQALTGWPPLAIAAARTWVADGGQLFLTGPNGTGKTSLAVAALLDRLRRRPGGRFITATELGAMYSADFDTGEPTRALAIAKRKAPLVLDDLGQERHNAQVAEIVKVAINARIEAGAPLILTSNFTPAQLAARELYGTWLGSRLAVMRQLHMGGRDHRLPHA
jgi:DNA replication protein DnaC